MDITLSTARGVVFHHELPKIQQKKEKMFLKRAIVRSARWDGGVLSVIRYKYSLQFLYGKMRVSGP